MKLRLIALLLAALMLLSGCLGAETAQATPAAEATPLTKTEEQVTTKATPTTPLETKEQAEATAEDNEACMECELIVEQSLVLITYASHKPSQEGENAQPFEGAAVLYKQGIPSMLEKFENGRAIWILPVDEYVPGTYVIRIGGENEFVETIYDYSNLGVDFDDERHNGVKIILTPETIENSVHQVLTVNDQPLATIFGDISIYLQ